MATTITLNPPSTTVVDHQIPNSTVLYRLRLLGSELSKALPKHLKIKVPKRKRKQASASASLGVEDKLTSSPAKTEDKKEEEIIQIQSPTSLNSTKSTDPSCLPLRNILVLKRKQASPKGQALEGKLPSSEEEATQIQPAMPSSATKMTILSSFKLKNVFVLKRKQTLPSKELEEKLPSSEEEEKEQKPLSSSTTEEKEEQKLPSSEEEQQKPPSSEEEEQQKPPSSSEEQEQEQQKPPSSSTTEEQEQQKPPSSKTEEQKPPSSTSEEDPSNSTKMTLRNCLPLKNIRVPKRKQALPSEGLEEKLHASSEEEKLPSSTEEDAIQTQPLKPSKSTKLTISSCFPVKNILPKRKQALSSEGLEKLPSSEETIQRAPSSSEPAPTGNDKLLALQ
ncbi:FK506-binding protein 5-like [Rosa chinensis]|uniref:FK506-binding protein 5-like n=1 Tax=Rosa chinensis TaxID=74649 RepID=UPI000D096CCB|nr:FK506-binding protein 5-like [Rosa chinensis]